MTLLALAYPELNKTDLCFIEQLRKENDSQGHSTLAAHFTFVFPTDDFSKSTFEKVMHANLAEQTAIDFVIRMAIFMPPLVNHQSWYAFLVPDEGFSDLTKLYNKAHQGELRSQMRYDFPYIPHITIGSFNEKERCIAAVKEINKQEIEIKGTIKKVALSEVIDAKVLSFSEIDLLS